MREIVKRHGGSMNTYTGDGYLACWPDCAESAAHIAAVMLAFRGHH